MDDMLLENSENFGVVPSVFDEIGDLARRLRSLASRIGGGDVGALAEYELLRAKLASALQAAALRF